MLYSSYKAVIMSLGDNWSYLPQKNQCEAKVFNVMGIFRLV